MNKKELNKIDKEIETQIMKIFELDKLDEIILTRTQLKRNIRIIGIIYYTSMARIMAKTIIDEDGKKK